MQALLLNGLRFRGGVRQGCPLSCLLFIIAVEILAQQIRNNHDIQGIRIGNCNHKLVQFADDTTCTVKNVDSVNTLFCTIDEFTKYSGLKLNKEKTKFLWLGPWQSRIDNPLNLEKLSETFNMLGAFIGRDLDTKIKKNYIDKLNCVRKTFNIWSGRNTTIMGRILLSKTFGVSNFVYSLSMTSPDVGTINHLQHEINKFIWNYKPPKVKHKTLIGKLEWGGLKAIDMKTMAESLSLAWLARIWDENEWSNILYKRCEKFGGFKFMIRCNNNFLNENLPTFYKSILENAHDMFIKPNAKCIIWNNKDILIEGKTVFYKEWYVKGIVYIQDLYSEYGRWLTYQEFKNKFNLQNCTLEFMGLLNCIKGLVHHHSEYKSINMQHKPNIDIESAIFDTIHSGKIHVKKSKSRVYYDLLLETIFKKPISLSKWINDWEISEIEYKNSMIYAKASTKDTRLLCFNYKMLNRINNNCYNLHKWKIKDSPYCEFCSEPTQDDTIHSLVECNWTCDKVEIILNSFGQDKPYFAHLNWKNWLVGVRDPALNNVILLIKYYITQVRSGLTEFSLNVMKRELHLAYITDRKISLVKSNIKWENFKQLKEESLQYEQSLI